MRRRQFMAALASTTIWPMSARAQQTDRQQRIGVLIGGGAESDASSQAYIAALREELARRGWLEDRNLRIDLRLGGDEDTFRAFATELVRFNPDVIVTRTAPATRAVQEQTHTIPIVFVGVGEAVANGLVKSLTRPEGNTTGVTNLFGSIGGKWVGLLKQVAPQLERIALIYNDQFPVGQAASIEAAASALRLQAIKIPHRSPIDIVRGIDAFAATPNGGLIPLPPPPSALDRKIILDLALQHRLPAIYQDPLTAAEGGLMAYGSNTVDLFRRAATYVDRIFRGTKVAELPVEYPTRFTLAINLKTARVLGLTIPETLLATADEVIQ
jgi:putative tryptophan/tyrosine transport system substrate-binding protein